MGFRLRTLLIASAVILPAMALEWWVFYGPRPDKMLLWYLSILLYRAFPFIVALWIAALVASLAIRSRPT